MEVRGAILFAKKNYSKVCAIVRVNEYSGEIRYSKIRV